MSKILEIHKLSAGYGPLRVLHEIDLSLNKGERIGLVGLNGHGKTTLIRAITHMTEWQQGSIIFNGIEIGGNRSFGAGRRTASIVRKGISVAPQGDAIFPGLTVCQHLNCGAFSKTAWNEKENRIQKIFEIFPPLKKLEHALVGKLSGGERRMVSIGRMLMEEAKLYLIDEPTLGLAPKIYSSLLNAIWSLNLNNSSMIIAEQNVGLLSKNVDRLIGIYAGKLRGEVGHVELK